MTTILLNKPVASSHRLERVHMFPGRHLGEEEFDRIQDYTDARLTPLLKGVHPGIVEGLEINLGPGGVGDVGFSVNPGIAVAGNGQTLGLYHPLRAEWQGLIGDYLAASGAGSAVGVYYLMLRRAGRKIDSATTTPCRRAEFDPSRDSRLVVTGGLFLHRLAIDPAAVTAAPREAIENWIAADRVDAAFMANLETSVPLALLAVRPDAVTGHAVAWLSQEAGRYEALPNGGYRVLLNQVTAAMRRVMQQAATGVTETTSLADFLRDNLHLDFLPAAAQLPLEWLQNPAATPPSLLWLPPHVGIDMVPVPEEGVLQLIHRHIARRVIDLRHPAGDRIRLLLAVNEPDYRGDLLDIPQTDAQLESDIYRFFMRAHEAWRNWHRQFDGLYFLREESALDAAQIKSLGLPKPEPPPVLPQAVFAALIERAAAELQDPDHPGTPYPFSKGVPAPPGFYGNWLVASPGGPVLPPLPEPSEDGLIPRFAVGLVELEAIENQIRAMRTRLEKTRDYLMVQRQQLDSQTVALAALAGGVAGDGTGLQVARWLPFTKLQPSWSKPPAPEEGSGDATPAPDAGGGAGKSGFSFAVMQPLNVASLAGKATFDRSLVDLGATASKSVSSGIKNRPLSVSAFELNLNQSRLSLLAKVPKQALTRPAFETKEYRFGVMDHISPEVNEYAKAYRAMAELFTTVDGLFDPSDAKSLKSKLRAVGVLKAPEEVEKEPGRTGHDETDKVNLVQARYAALFQAGQILTKQIAVVEARYNAIEAKLERKLREHSDKQAHLQKLSALIRAARENLETLDGLRVEQLGDYGVAQRLLDEDWQRVYRINQERTRILTKGIRGLYYVRVRPTPVSAALADPLALRHGAAGDIVPGCDWTEDVQLPEELDTFFNAVTEIPMDDWAALRDLKIGIPPVQQFDYLNALRQSRFKARPTQPPPAAKTGSLQARLSTVHRQNQIVLQTWALASLPGFLGTSGKTQAEAARVLSLEDLASMKAGLLRKPAHELREKLEMCQYCLLERLNLLAPSLRLQWAQLAEDDQLRVENVAWWPGLEKAERDDFNATRTVAELIAWWFRQLAAEASANSRSAMHNMIRAALIFASLGDPAEIVRGNVHVPPRAVAVGERLQVKLNRAPTPGTRLQLLDTQQRVVAVLAVEDHGAQSTQVQIVDLVHKDIRINTRFSVVANKRTAKLKGS